jgi:PAS domain S-box-containing protein
MRGATIHPSEDDERKTPVRGYFLVARVWNRQYLAELAQVTGKAMRIEPARAGAKPPAEIARQSGEITFTRPLPGPLGKPELMLIASLRPGWTAVALSSGHGQFAQQTSLALLAVLGLTLVLWFWVTRPLGWIRRSLESGSTEALKPLERNRTEFGQLAQLVGQFFGQNAALVKEVTERKQAEAELAAQVERTGILFEHAPDAYYLCDFSGTFLDGNRAAEELLGYPRKELVGASFLKLNLLPASELAKAAGLLVRSALGQATGPDELVLERKDGTMVSVEICTHVVTIHGRKVVLGSARDITERKRTEMAARESEQRYRETIDALPEAVFETGPDGRLTLVNRSGLAALGLAEADIARGVNVFQLLVPEDRERAAADTRRVMCGESRPGAEYMAQRKDGSRFPAIVHADRVIRDGQPVGLRGILIDISARKRAEAALRESDEKYRLVVDNASEAILVAQDGNIVFTNPRTSEIIGYPREELLGRPFTEFIHPDDRALVADNYRKRILGDDLPDRYEFRIVGRGGKMLYVEISAVRIDWLGRPATLNFLADVTERRQAEVALRESEVQNQALISAFPDMLFTNRRDGEFLTVHTSHPELLFAPPAAFLHRKIKDVMPKSLGDSLMKAIVDALDLEAVQELNYVLPVGGEERQYEARVTPLARDTVITIVRDVTDRKRAEEDLKLKAELLDSSTDSIFLHDPAGRFLYVNEGTYRTRGYTKEEFLALNLHDIDVPEQAARIEARVAEMMRTGEATFESAQFRRDGSVMPVEVHARMLEVGGRKLILSVVRDITDRKKIETELAQKNTQLVELNDVKNQLLGMAAHDLRNPLSVVSTASSFLLDDAGRLLPEAKRTDFLRRINSSSEFMLHMIDDLLDVAKIEAGKLDLEFEDGDLCVLIDENLTMNRMLAEKKGIRLDFVPERSLPPFRFDRGKVEQVLNNLISNALKFSVPGTAVAVQASRVNGNVVVSVRDHGQGIPAEELDKLFKPFSKTSARGTAGEKSTGLGLAICRKIVEGHHGRIWAESEVGKGSVFSFSLPLAESV